MSSIYKKLFKCKSGKVIVPLSRMPSKLFKPIWKVKVTDNQIADVTRYTTEEVIEIIMEEDNE